MSSRPPIDGKSRPRPLEVALVGNDLVLAALPARPVQLAHAILACGYDHVVPVSWGEELVAEHALRALAERAPSPVIMSACVTARARLLAAGPELESRVLSFVSPAVATARYLRALHPTTRMRITYIGACETRGDAAVNAVIAPSEMLRRLAERGISAVRQPAVFEGIIPPDRRRHFSLPGGAPSNDALVRRLPGWTVVSVDEEDFSVTLAERLLSREPVVIDVARRLGCACCAASGRQRSVTRLEAIDVHATFRLEDLEPPRSPSPVLDHDIDVPLLTSAGRRHSAMRAVGPELEPAHDVSPRDVVAPTASETSRVIPVARETPRVAAAALVTSVAAARPARRPIAVTPSSVPMVAAPLAHLHVGATSHLAATPRVTAATRIPPSAEDIGTASGALTPYSDTPHTEAPHADIPQALMASAARSQPSVPQGATDHRVHAPSLHLDADATPSAGTTASVDVADAGTPRQRVKSEFVRTPVDHRGPSQQTYHLARKGSHVRAARAAAGAHVRAALRRGTTPSHLPVIAQPSVEARVLPEAPHSSAIAAACESSLAVLHASEANQVAATQPVARVDGSTKVDEGWRQETEEAEIEELRTPAAVTSGGDRDVMRDHVRSVTSSSRPLAPLLPSDPKPVRTMRASDYSPHGLSPSRPRTLLSFVITAIGILMLVFAVAMILRRNPLAPW